MVTWRGKAKIYMVRHGLTDANLEGIFRENNGYGLNKIGREQAQEVAEKLSHIRFHFAFSSPYKRAKQTAKIILDGNFDGRIRTDHRLVERFYGEFTGLKYKPIEEAEFDMKAFSTIGPHQNKFKSAEKILDVERRVHNFITEMKLRHPGKNILVASHGGTLRHAKTYIHGRPPSGDYGTFRVKNCEIIEIDNGGPLEKRYVRGFGVAKGRKRGRNKVRVSEKGQRMSSRYASR